MDLRPIQNLLRFNGLFRLGNEVVSRNRADHPAKDVPVRSAEVRDDVAAPFRDVVSAPVQQSVDRGARHKLADLLINR